MAKNNHKNPATPANNREYDDMSARDKRRFAERLARKNMKKKSGPVAQSG